MATAFRSSASASKVHIGGTDTLTINKPTGTLEGDMLIAILGINGTAATNYALSGWTSLANANDGSNYGIKILWKIAGASEGASYGFTIAGIANNGMVGAIICVSSDEFGGAGNITVSTDVNVSATTTHTFTPGITPPSTNSLLIHGAFGRGLCTFSTYAITNNNPTWTEREDLQINATDDSSLGVATATPSAASATGDWTLTLSSSLEAVGFLLSVQESANATGTPAFVSSTQSAFPPTAVEAGTTATLAFAGGSTQSAFTPTSGKATSPTQWTNETKPSTTWTNEQI